LILVGDWPDLRHAPMYASNLVSVHSNTLATQPIDKKDAVTSGASQGLPQLCKLICYTMRDGATCLMEASYTAAASGFIQEATNMVEYSAVLVSVYEHRANLMGIIKNGLAVYMRLALADDRPIVGELLKQLKTKDPMQLAAAAAHAYVAYAHAMQRTIEPRVAAGVLRMSINTHPVTWITAVPPRDLTAAEYAIKAIIDESNARAAFWRSVLDFAQVYTMCENSLVSSSHMCDALKSYGYPMLLSHASKSHYVLVTHAYASMTHKHLASLMQAPRGSFMLAARENACIKFLVAIGQPKQHKALVMPPKAKASAHLRSTLMKRTFTALRAHVTTGRAERVLEKHVGLFRHHATACFLRRRWRAAVVLLPSGVAAA